MCVKVVVLLVVIEEKRRHTSINDRYNILTSLVDRCAVCILSFGDGISVSRYSRKVIFLFVFRLLCTFVWRIFISVDNNFWLVSFSSRDPREEQRSWESIFFSPVCVRARILKQFHLTESSYYIRSDVWLTINDDKKKNYDDMNENLSAVNQK